MAAEKQIKNAAKQLSEQIKTQQQLIGNCSQLNVVNLM